MGNVDENYPLNSSLPALQLIFTSFYFQSFFNKNIQTIDNIGSDILYSFCKIKFTIFGRHWSSYV